MTSFKRAKVTKTSISNFTEISLNFYSVAEQCFDVTSSKQQLTFQDSFGRIIFSGKKRPKKKTSSGPQLISPNLENHANKPAIIHSFYCAKGCSQSCP